MSAKKPYWVAHVGRISGRSPEAVHIAVKPEINFLDIYFAPHAVFLSCGFNENDNNCISIVHYSV